MNCCCSLAGTRACLSCPNGWEWNGALYWFIPPWVVGEPKPKRVIEKFDKDGKLIERVTEG